MHLLNRHGQDCHSEWFHGGLRKEQLLDTRGEICGVGIERSMRKLRVAVKDAVPTVLEFGEPPLTALEDSIIYEMHVRGFTCHPTSGVAHPGTFAGLVEKIPYLLKLGVTAVELLPVHEFDEDDCPFSNPQTGDKLRNFWGYNSIAFGAPKAAYEPGAG